MRRLTALAACLAALAFIQPPPAAPQAAARAAQQVRDTREKAVEVIRAMGLEPGMTVADVGAGWGFMTPFLSEAVGPSGRVIAQDIDAGTLRRAEETARERNLANVTFVVGTKTDPKLPEGSADAALVRDAYHHFDQHEAMLAAVRKALRPGGRLAIVDYYKRPGAMRGMDAVKHIRADEDQVVKEIEQAGFRLLSRAVHVEGSQYLLVFARE